MKVSMMKFSKRVVPSAGTVVETSLARVPGCGFGRVVPFAGTVVETCVVMFC